MAATFKSWIAKFRWASMLMKIIVINTAVFAILSVLKVISVLFMAPGLFSDVLRFVSLPSDLGELLVMPWTLLTYMFSQYEIFHTLFNMLWLYWFGSIFCQLTFPKRLLPVYIYGGLAGALLFLVAFNTLPLFVHTTATLIGSSASVLAVVCATAMIAPDYRVNLLFLGGVSIKWIAIVTVAIDFLSLTGGNFGGHIAHLGGALMGVVYALALRRGTDLAAPLNRLCDKIANLLKPRPKIVQQPKQKRGKNVKKETASMDEIDTILDKIKKSGYTSLTPEERSKLFSAGQKYKS